MWLEHSGIGQDLRDLLGRKTRAVAPASKIKKSRGKRGRASNTKSPNTLKE